MPQHARTHAHAILVPLAALGILAGCSDVELGDPVAGKRVIVGAYDPADGLTVRLHDLVVLAGADLHRLGGSGCDMIPILSGPKDDDLGRTVVTIRTTGMHAASFAEDGLIAEGHRVVEDASLAPGTGEAVQATEVQCPWSAGQTHFQWFDDSGPITGIKTELLAMDDAMPPIRVKVKAIATTPAPGNRPVLAVRVGPLNGQIANTRVPTVYMLGTVHAREWISTEVVLRLARYYNLVAKQDPSVSDPMLYALLANNAVVFVPVVNPDGYQYTHTTNRLQRKNRKDTCLTSVPGDIKDGVDLNRNHSVAWNTFYEAPWIDDSDKCGDTYRGDVVASELETQAIETLLLGDAFAYEEFGRWYDQQGPAATATYHAAGDLLIYPPGYKNDPSPGFNCAVQGNCVHPDFNVYREFYGDTAAPILQEKTSNTFSGTTPYRASMQNNISYATSGGTTLFASYNATRKSLAVTPELLATDQHWFIECEITAPNTYQVIVDELVAQNKTLLTDKLLANAAGFLTQTAAASPVATRLGKSANGQWAREMHDPFLGQEHLQRPLFLKPSWLPTDPVAPDVLHAFIDGTDHDMDRGTKGAQYHLWRLSIKQISPMNWNQFPCLIRFGDGSNDQIPGCPTGWHDLTDASKLTVSPANSWQLLNELPPGPNQQLDWFWQPNFTGAAATLTQPVLSAAPSGVTQCRFSFTTKWNPNYNMGGAGGPVILEREDPSGWTTIFKWHEGLGPIGGTRYAHRHRSEVVEAPFDPVTLVPRRFRFRIPSAADGGSQPASFRLYEPVTYCRIGSLP